MKEEREPQKFDDTKPCNLEPYGFIEEKFSLQTKHCGEIMIIAYGAKNVMGHYAFDLGGLAYLHIKPNIIIAERYHPWNMEARLFYFKRMKKHLELNQNTITPEDPVR